MSALILLVLFGGLAHPARAAAEPEPAVPADVTNALKRNAQQAATLTVKWRQQLSSPLAPAILEARFGIDAQTARGLFASRVQEVTVQDHCIYSREERALEAGAQVMESSFDGSRMYIGNPDDRDASGSPAPTLTKLDVPYMTGKKPGSTWMAVQYFEAVGLDVPDTSADLGNKSVVNSSVLQQLANGGRLRSISQVPADGANGPLVRVETEVPDPAAAEASAADPEQVRARLQASDVPEDKIRRHLANLEQQRKLPPSKHVVTFLDPAAGHAVVRQAERRPDGTLLMDVNNGALEKVAGRELWLPKESRVRRYSWGGAEVFAEPVTVLDVKVDAFDTARRNVDLFTLTYTRPGTSVYEFTGTGNTFFQVPAAPSDLDAALGTLDASGLPAAASGSVVAADGARPGARPTEARLAAAQRIPAWRTGMVIGLTAAAVIGLTGLVVLVLRRRARRGAAGARGPA